MEPTQLVQLAVSVLQISYITDTRRNDIIEALTGLAWSEEEASEIRSFIDKL
jgi:hypothetical protein